MLGLSTRQAPTAGHNPRRVNGLAHIERPETMSTNHTIRIAPESKTYANAQASDYPLAYAMATHAASGILRRDKSLQWADALQCAALALCEAGHDPCQKIPQSGELRIPAGLVSAIKRHLQAMAAPVNGFTRGKDSQESADRKALHNHLNGKARTLRSNPEAIARKAIAYNLFPKLNAFDIYRRLEDLKSLNGHDWSRAVSYAMPKVSPKGLWRLAEAPSKARVTGTLHGPDLPPSSPREYQSYGCPRW